MASYSFKKEDLDKSKDDTGLNFPKGIRHKKRMMEEARKNNKLHGMSYKEISLRANQYESHELGKGINHGERRCEKGFRYNQRTSKFGTSYRQYF